MKHYSAATELMKFNSLILISILHLKMCKAPIKTRQRYRQRPK